MPSKILIIGGGLSGLSLAQICRRNGLDFEIFERDRDVHARTQGWAISLRECLAGIYKMFPEDMPPLEESVSVFKGLDPAGELRQAMGGAVHYETGETIVTMKAAGRDDITHHWIRANRARFRAWLQHGLDVKWDKQCMRYEETADGVRAHFADGTWADGSLLVAADGSTSRVRAQLFGQDRAHFEIAPLAALVGDVNLSEADYSDMLTKGSAFFTVNNPRYQFFVGVRDFQPTPTKIGEYYWSVSWDDKADGDDRPQENTGTASEEDPHGQPKTGEPARQLCLRRTADMHPSLRRLIEETKADQMGDTAVMLRQWAPPAGTTRLPGSRVTLMGDALHTMTPFRGAGANTAIIDALEIGQLLLQARAAGKDFADIIPPYEQVAVPRGRATMEFSRSAGLSPDPYHWSRIMKKVFDEGYEWKELEKKL